MDFALPPEIEALARRTREFVAAEIMPVEADRASWDEHENIRLDRLEELRTKAKAAGLWAPQTPRAFGGMGLSRLAMAAMYQEANRSIFGPVVFNAAAPDDGNMMLLAKVGTPAQQARWLQPIVDGAVRSAFAMTEPAPGGGSDPDHDPHPCRAPRRRVGDRRAQMVHHRRRRGPALHPDRPDLGRSAPRAHRLPVRPRPAGLGDRAAHPDHGAGGAWRPLRAQPSTGCRSRTRTC